MICAAQPNALLASKYKACVQEHHADITLFPGTANELQ